MKHTKRIIAVFLAAIFALTTFMQVSSTVNAATAGNKVVIHWTNNVANNDYKTFRFWIWFDTGGGVVYEATSVDSFGAVIEVPYTSAQTIGFIALSGATGDTGSTSWPGGTKDVSSDITITISTLSVDESGNPNLYLVSKDPTPYPTPDLINFKEAYFESLTSIYFNISLKDYSAAPEIIVKENGVVIPNATVSAITSAGGYITVPTADFGNSYTLEATVNGNTYVIDVNLDKLFDSNAFNDSFYYEGTDLGATYAKGSTTFKLWAPISTSVQLCLYEAGHTKSVRADGADTPYKTVDMTKGDKGVWSAIVTGDLDSIYYTYKVTNGSKTNEVVDPYAKSTGVNGVRGMVVNLAGTKTTPAGFSVLEKPDFSGNYVDSIIYELHVRDLTSSSTWTGTEANRGKFLGVAEAGTTYTADGVTVSTGLDHLVELGITHLQLLPTQDAGMVDETRLDDAAYKELEIDGIFNWGYMTNNFNALEGSYSTNPYDGNVRIYEFRQMIQTLHKNGIRVNMDVVYNHTGSSTGSNFDQIIPGYYHRMTNGAFSNGSGCGNETASERPMMRKFMVESLCYYAEQFGVDGYRFDLMSLHDYTTMNTIYDELSKIDNDIMVYGEPWTGGTTTLSGSQQATKETMNLMPNVASFCDYSRDGYKGSRQDFEAGTFGVIYDKEATFNKGGAKYGISGGTVGSSSYSYVNPNQIINYLECHDNATLFDKLACYYYNNNVTTTFPLITNSHIKIKLAPKAIQAASMLLTSQGVAFLDSGIEMLRSKGGDSNSYNKNDSVNQLDWSRKISYSNVFESYKQLIDIRKNHESLTLETFSQINSSLTFLDSNSDTYIGYELTSTTDTWQDYIVLHNIDNAAAKISVDNATYTCVFNSKSETYTVGSRYTTNEISLAAGQSVILVKKFAAGADPNETTETPTTSGVETTTPSKKGGCNQSVFQPEGALGLLGLSGLGIGLFFALKPRKENGVL